MTNTKTMMKNKHENMINPTMSRLTIRREKKRKKALQKTFTTQHFGTIRLAQNPHDPDLLMPTIAMLQVENDEYTVVDRTWGAENIHSVTDDHDTIQEALLSH